MSTVLPEFPAGTYRHYRGTTIFILKKRGRGGRYTVSRCHPPPPLPPGPPGWTDDGSRDPYITQRLRQKFQNRISICCGRQGTSWFGIILKHRTCTSLQLLVVTFAWAPSPTGAGVGGTGAGVPTPPVVLEGGEVVLSEADMVFVLKSAHASRQYHANSRQVSSRSARPRLASPILAKSRQAKSSQVKPRRAEPS